MAFAHGRRRLNPDKRFGLILISVRCTGVVYRGVDIAFGLSR